MSKKRVVILATGGTIAGVGEPGENLGYKSGTLSGTDLVAAMPQLAEIADVTVEQICNVNSDDITDKIWLRLSRRVNELQMNPDVDGIVITHGTDTMEETAYFLSLTVDGSLSSSRRGPKPVVLTGSMRPATAKEPDGPANLLGAVRTVVSFVIDDEPLENFVWVYFGEMLFDACHVQKCSASDLMPMGGNFPGDGSCRKASAEKNFFDVSRLQSLPRVNVVYFAVDANPRILEFASSVSDGVVIAGAGAGEFSLEWAHALENVDIPVVLASRINHGIVTLNKSLALAPDGVARISAGELPPAKAAVLLRLALTQTTNPKKLMGIFSRGVCCCEMRI